MPLRFRKQHIATSPYEAAGVVDVDGDGILDLVCGSYWYQGPDFRRIHWIGPLLQDGEYFDDLGTVVLDIDGDGRPDLVSAGWWGNVLRWRQNPGNGDTRWAEHTIAQGLGPVESTRAWDVDGDGHLEIVPNTPYSPLCAYRLRRDADGKAMGVFDRHVIHEGSFGHGLGFGDVNGDGRGCFITPRGILSPPDAGPWSGPWRLSDEIDLGADASLPVLVADINGDGVNELIVGHAHSYGLDWWEQRRAGSRRSWVRHPIDPGNSQFHDLQWADIDGDGVPELITGKRYRAHAGRDPGEFDDVGIYYYKWTGEGFAKQIISFGPPGIGKGCGIQFALADLLGTGRLDVVAPGKDGLAVFFNEGA
jgi:hypothetical protein